MVARSLNISKGYVQVVPPSLDNANKGMMLVILKKLPALYKWQYCHFRCNLYRQKIRHGGSRIDFSLQILKNGMGLGPCTSFIGTDSHKEIGCRSLSFCRNFLQRCQTLSPSHVDLVQLIANNDPFLNSGSIAVVKFLNMLDGYVQSTPALVLRANKGRNADCV